MTRLRAQLRTRRLICIMAAAIAAALIAVAVAGSTTFAHTLSKTKEVYTDSVLCVKGRAELRHGSMYGRTESHWGSSCHSKKPQPANKIRVRVILSYHNGSSTSICRDSGWQVNDEGEWEQGVQGTYSSNTPCGDGEYTVTTNAYVYESGQWRGDIVYPGWHRFS